MKTKLVAAQMLIAAAKQNVSAYAAVIAAMRQAVAEKVYGDATAGEPRLKATIEWAKLTLAKSGDAYNTSRVYIANGAALALSPLATATISTGKGDEKSTREVTATSAKTAREVSAVAERAREMITGKKKARRAAVETATTANVLTQKTAELAANGHIKPMAEMLAACFDGKHSHMRETLISELAKHGFVLAPVKTEATAPVNAKLPDDATKYLAGLAAKKANGKRKAPNGKRAH